MKNIISTTGSKINFVLNQNRSFVFDPTSPIEVTEEEFTVLNKRLGSQLRTIESKIAEEKIAEAKIAKIAEAKIVKTPKVEPLQD